ARLDGPELGHHAGLLPDLPRRLQLRRPLRRDRGQRPDVDGPRPGRRQPHLLRHRGQRHAAGIRPHAAGPGHLPMSRLRDDAGISLVEILISMTIMAVVLAATFDALDLFQRQVADETVRVDSRDQLRTTLDRLVKPLRSAVETTAGMVESAGAYDLVY